MEATNQYDGTIIEKQLRTVKVSELFELVTGIKTFDQDLPEGPYPYISASSSYNGITSYVNEFSYDSGNDYVISVTGFGSSGVCFVQHGKFAIRGHGSIMILKLKPEYKYLEECLGVLAFTMTQYFTSKYSYNNSLNNKRLMSEEIPNIPFIQDLRDKNNWIIDVSGLKYMYL